MRLGKITFFLIILKHFATAIVTKTDKAPSLEYANKVDGKFMFKVDFSESFQSDEDLPKVATLYITSKIGDKYEQSTKKIAGGYVNLDICQRYKELRVGFDGVTDVSAKFSYEPLHFEDIIVENTCVEDKVIFMNLSYIKTLDFRIEECLNKVYIRQYVGDKFFKDDLIFDKLQVKDPENFGILIQQNKITEDIDRKTFSIRPCSSTTSLSLIACVIIFLIITIGVGVGVYALIKQKKKNRQENQADYVTVTLRQRAESLIQAGPGKLLDTVRRKFSRTPEEEPPAEVDQNPEYGLEDDNYYRECEVENKNDYYDNLDDDYKMTYVRDNNDDYYNDD